MLNDNQPGGLDRVGHSSVQAWSAGPLFPAVIAVVEVYERFESPAGAVFYQDREDITNYAEGERAFYAQPLEARLRYRAFELNYPGRDLMSYGSRDDAEDAARGLKMYDEAARAARRSVGAYDYGDAEGFARRARQFAHAMAAPYCAASDQRVGVGQVGVE